MRSSTYRHRQLDLSFNLFKSIEPLKDESPESPHAYPHLTHLYLIQNKLSRIEGVRHRLKLQYLELGGNRLRVSRPFSLRCHLPS